MKRYSVNVMTNACGAAALCFCVCGLTAVQAQTVFCATSGNTSGRCGGLCLASEPVVTGEPYQAQSVTELQQTTANGTHIAQTSTATIARDSEGRTMRSETMQGIRRSTANSGSPEQSAKVTLTTIFDPVAKEHIDFTSDSAVAHAFSLAPAETNSAAHSVAGPGDMVAGPTVIGMGIASGTEEGGGISVAVGASPLGLPSPSTVSTLSLGTKTIDGVQATGTRSTSTVPVGAVGNDQPLVSTQDTWYSPELKMVLQSIHSDPRTGVTTYSVTNLQREEPEPGLFQAPPGYTVQQVNGQVVIGTGEAQN